MQRHVTWLLTSVLLSGAACVGALCFHAIAQAKGIHDARASQVSVFYALQLLTLWLTGCRACRRGRATTQRMFVGGCFGVLGETVLAGALAVGSAYANLHVTPPLAWLGLSFIGGVAFVVAARRARGC